MADEFDSLVDSLDTPSKRVRRDAAGRLAAAAANPNGAARLQALLDDHRPACRWGAAFALDMAGLRDSRVALVAVETLADRDADLRWAASGILGRCALELPETVAMLEKAAAGPSDERAKMAIYCLRDMGAERGALYRRALGRRDSGVRFAALSALAKCRELAASDIDAMEEVAVSDADQGVRRAARALLDKRAGGG